MITNLCTPSEERGSRKPKKYFVRCWGEIPLERTIKRLGIDTTRDIDGLGEFLDGLNGHVAESANEQEDMKQLTRNGLWIPSTMLPINPTTT